MTNLRLTAAQAMVRFLAAQRTVVDGAEHPLFAGCWAIFGHGNVAGLGEALQAARDVLPTYRAHNEQAMAHAAIAFAKARNRRQMMVCTTSIGPGATNMVTAAALAHVNRLPVLLVPGDVFAGRGPDPVLQQIEDFADATVSANDCFRPVSRYFDRITRPEQLLAALPAALRVLTDPAACGPVTLAFCQDVQAEAFDYPEPFFAPRIHAPRRPAPDPDEVARAAALLAGARRPLIVAGGGVHYAEGCPALAAFAEAHAIPVAETQGGKGALPWDHPLAVGAIGVTGSAAANALAADADLILGVGTRLQDFTTGSRRLFADEAALVQLNVQPFDAGKHGALALVADARAGLAALDAALGSAASPAGHGARIAGLKAEWDAAVEAATSATIENPSGLPSDAQIVGAVNRAAGPDGIVVCAAGGLPGELHKLWRTARPGGYHVEYGYSCMGYEIAAGLGVALACPDRPVFVTVGDGSYLMMNSEIHTAVMLGLKLTVVLLDNRGYGCIDRLQRACGGAGFNNLIADVDHRASESWVDFAGHARSLGAHAEHADSLDGLTRALDGAAGRDGVSVVVIDTDPRVTTAAGGAWWEVAVPAVSPRPEVRRARAAYEAVLSERR
ncbi:3D-(3,5/4)-trihydroxycyclohexane-1,2-dione hydrolase [Methylobacterium crusticola]|uniref:3D-(3,5/4)-trihydroxycyclohexane-1,2-dione hydrolase n=1 Tax=Methylobacterium crusticola TaxID=1697972 RepID=A0ABQ4QR74_9HYPH|nr:3D-(3,5/4)-trihydroxycyclohexane-1,2-dione acylhydrolase (decyclizing) [Methylobacterium crusticola]GJD47788.1 3D-(3,5/4)-trihydroxycyclohexane-1,2-dione hydrolase [Methylobacterium crusticola]